MFVATMVIVLVGSTIGLAQDQEIEKPEEPEIELTPAEAATREIGESLKIAEAQQALASAATIPDVASDRSDPLLRNDIVRFIGNEAVLTPVLRFVVNLEQRSGADPRTAERIEEQLQRFYEATGYDLARVRATVADDRIDVYIAEGRINKVVFKGVSTLRAVDLQFDFQLPAGVYNRYFVATEIRRLSEKYNFKAMEPEIVERSTGSATSLGKLLPGFRATDDTSVLQTMRTDYELHMRCRHPEGSGGTRFGLDVLLPYGLRARIGYGLRSAFLEGDRFDLDGSVSGDATQQFTRATGAATYVLPPVLASWLRPNFRIRSSLVSLSRSDIGLGKYLLTRNSASTRLGISFGRHFLFSLGAGIRHDDPFEIERTELTPPEIDSEHRVDPFGVLELRLDLQPSIMRRDQRHSLLARVHHYSPFEEPLTVGHIQYQKVFKIGYDDLYLRVRGHVLGGAATWRDEIGLGSKVIRVIPGSLSFAARLAEGGLEYRYSLVRDLLKVNVFAGGAVFDGLSLSGYDRDPTWTAAFGPGASAMILNVFGIDLYYAVGVNEFGDISGAVNFAIEKVY